MRNTGLYWSRSILTASASLFSPSATQPYQPPPFQFFLHILTSQGLTPQSFNFLPQNLILISNQPWGLLITSILCVMSSLLSHALVNHLCLWRHYKSFGTQLKYQHLYEIIPGPPPTKFVLSFLLHSIVLCTFYHDPLLHQMSVLYDCFNPIPKPTLCNVRLPEDRNY